MYTPCQKENQTNRKRKLLMKKFPKPALTFSTDILMYCKQSSVKPCRGATDPFRYSLLYLTKVSFYSSPAENGVLKKY